MTSHLLRDRILVVDDSPTNVAILMDALENDYEVSFANSGQEALTLIADAGPPDLVLLDVMMPEMDGYEVCRRLKADPATRDIAIIFVTAMDSGEAESAGLTLGADDYITKPLNLGIARLRIHNLLERRRLHRDLELSLEGARQGLWSWDMENDLVTFSSRWAAPLGYSADEAPPPPRPWAAFVHPDDLPRLHVASAAHVAGSSASISVELRLRNKHDAFVWVQVLGRIQPHGSNGTPSRATGTYLDIAQRKQDEARLSEQQERLRTLIHSIPDIVVGFDTANVITEMHVPAAQQDWLPQADGAGRPYRDLLPAELSAALDAGMVACFDDAGPHTFECEIQLGERTRYFSATVSRLADHDTWPSGFLAVVREVTEVRKAEQELRQMAFHDPLTGLANRRLLEDRLHQATLFSAREHAWAAVIVLDLDRFKELNDTHGHETGDRLLVEFARRLRDSVREIDTVARLGGDEFVVILQHLGKTEAEARASVQPIADKMLIQLERDYDLGKIHHRCPVSLGIRLFSGEQVSIHQLLEDADVAMYHNKQQRKASKPSRG